jgi:hypothetical protein
VQTWPIVNLAENPILNMAISPIGIMQMRLSEWSERPRTKSTRGCELGTMIVIDTEQTLVRNNSDVSK